MPYQRNKPQYVLVAGLFSISGSIFYLAHELSELPRDAGIIAEKVQRTSQQIAPMISEVSKIRQEIPAILEELKHLREQIPAILSETQRVREQVPKILSESKEVRLLVPGALKEFQETREILPSIVAEVAATRKAIPAILEKTEQLIREGSDIGRTASEGVVTGVLSGLITSPFRLIAGIGEIVLGDSNERAAQLTPTDERREWESRCSDLQREPNDRPRKVIHH